MMRCRYHTEALDKSRQLDDGSVADFPVGHCKWEVIVTNARAILWQRRDFRQISTILSDYAGRLRVPNSSTNQVSIDSPCLPPISLQSTTILPATFMNLIANSFKLTPESKWLSTGSNSYSLRGRVARLLHFTRLSDFLLNVSEMIDLLRISIYRFSSNYRVISSESSLFFSTQLIFRGSDLVLNHLRTCLILQLHLLIGFDSLFQCMYKYLNSKN